MKNLSLKLFLAVMYIISIITFIGAYKTRNYIPYSFGKSFSIYDVLFFILLSIILESFIIMYGKTAVSTGFAATVACMLYFDIFWSMVIICTAISFRFAKYEGRRIHLFNTPLYKTLFNISAMSISIYTSGISFYYYLTISKTGFIYNLASGFIIFIFVFLIINSLIMSLLISIWKEESFLKNFTGYISFGFLDIVFISPFGVILFYLYKFYGPIGTFLFLIPIILLRHVFKLYTD